MSEFMTPVTSFANAYHMGHVSHNFEYTVVGTTIVVLAFVVYLTFSKYVSKGHVPVRDSELSGIQKVLANKFYIDEFYNAIITKPMDFLSRVSYKYIENGFIDKIVNSFGSATNNASSLLRLSQQGNLGYYLFAMVFAIVFMLIAMMVI